MVEAVVSYAVERLGDLLIREAIFLHGVHEQVHRLQNELTRMQCFLQDAEAKQVTDERVRNWIAEVRDVAYDSEDVIDTFILKVAFKRRGGIRGFLKSYVFIFNKWVHLHKVGNEIQSILTRIQGISASRIAYGIANVGESLSSSIEKEKLQRQLRESYPHIDDEDVIGLEDQIQTLVSELIKEEKRCCVISIVGVGGLGKTTLAKKVYKHDDVKRHFECFGWTSISQQCSRRDALYEILKKVSALEMEAIRELNEKDLVEELYKFLEGKRYLVVLDDIWRVEDWDILRPAFPNGKIGSKILLTTRNKEVASHADPWSLHFEPRVLTEDESWKLLCKKAFPKNVADRNCSVAEFETLGKEMVGKCGCLPLGVVVLGGLLATKGALVHEWEVVRQNIHSYMNKGQNGVSAILALSYIDLPYHLKPCFLYLAFFPEDSEISIKKLVHFWVAEGFVKQEGETTLEDVGVQQLTELTQRCMVQIGERGRASGRIKTCWMHDLMRDLCLSKARQENFLDIFDVNHGNIATFAASPSYNRLRRYAIHNSTKEEGYVSLCNLTTSSHLRSLMIVDSNVYINFDTSIKKGCYQNIKLLRVLDLRHVPNSYHVKHVMEHIGKLIHLVYFGMLRGGGHGEVPTSICNLRSLQTLYLRDLHGCLPNTMWKMGQLRHLYLNQFRSTCNWRMSTWTNIQTLYWIGAGKWIEEGDLGKMTSLRKLGICKLTTSQARLVLQSSSSSSCSTLRSLSLCMMPGNSFPNQLADALSDCHHLLPFSLDGHMETLPRFSPNLTKLTLIQSRLEQDPMETLEDLPNLKYLYLGIMSYVGHQMVCSSNGKRFPQLQFLTICWLPELRVWRVDQGAMPHLNCLTISHCKMMEMVPEGLRFVATLREFDVKYMSPEFNLRIVGGGEDWYKVQHIPSIKIQEN